MTRREREREHTGGDERAGVCERRQKREGRVSIGKRGKGRKGKDEQILTSSQATAEYSSDSGQTPIATCSCGQGRKREESEAEKEKVANERETRRYPVNFGQSSL
jgi:hypothetical protein